MDTEIQKHLQQIKKMIEGNTLDEKVYDEIENFILKNESSLGKRTDFQHLKETLSEAAAKFGKKDIYEAQEHFGLNSCAQ